jgi:uncharacterized phiE125 gp8 family phage protein
MEIWMIRAPEREPVTLDEAAAFVGGVEAGQEYLLSCLLVSARIFLEGEIGRVLVAQGWSLTCPAWPAPGALAVPPPLAPLVGVDAIRTGRGDAAVAIDPAGFAIEAAAEGPRLVVRDSAAREAVAAARGGVGIDLTAGYGARPADVPEPLRRAVLDLAGHWFERREPISFGRGTLPMTDRVEALVAPYRTGSARHRRPCRAA